MTNGRHRHMAHCALVLILASGVSAADWPTFRGNAGRTAVTREQLPARLHLQWSRQFPELIASWLGEFPHLRFDGSYEPIIVGKTLYFASSDDDSITALNTETGDLRWRFYVNGPVRLAPVGYKGRIYFGAENGTFYCLDGESGKVLWTFDTAVSKRKGFIEGRLTTISPIRGGPVIDNGQVHFAAGIWSWEPAGFFSLDPETGKLIRRQEGWRGQGYLSAFGKYLSIPNGRVRGIRLTRENAGWAGGLGGWAGYRDHLVTGTGEWVVRMGSLQKWAGEPRGEVCEPGPGRSAICFYRPIIDGDVVYYSSASKVVPRRDKAGPEVGDVVALSLKDPELVDAKDAKGNPVLNRRGKPQTKLLVKELWRVPNKEVVAALGGATANKGDFLILDIKAGTRLHGHRGSTVFALDLPAGDEPARVTWQAEVDGAPVRMLAADGKLFVVTQEGRFYCFAGKQGTPKVHPPEERPVAQTDDRWTRQTKAVLAETGASDGYCLVLGLKSGRLIEEIFRQSRMHVIAMDDDPMLVRALREKLYYLKDPRPNEETRQTTRDGSRLSASPSSAIDPMRRRIAIHEADPMSFAFPPYMATLILSEEPQKLDADPARVIALFDVLRPYGGAMYLEDPKGADHVFVKLAAARHLPEGQVTRRGGLTLLSRPGALPGAGEWTHEWADAANTLKSHDRLQFPLGMLWTGGRSARRSMYLDRHYVPPAPVVIGGRMFITGPDRLAAVDIYTGRIMWEVQSQVFTSMTRGRGGCHTIGAADAIYVSNRQTIFRFDPATGKSLSEFALPPGLPKGSMWGRAWIWENMLIASIRYAARDGRLLAVDRYSGKRLWEIKADSSFSHLAIGNDRILTWDGSKHDLKAIAAARRGQPAPVIPGRHMKAFDVRNGKVLWRTKTDSVVDWVSYSEEMDVVVASTKKRIQAYRGRDGEELWRKHSEGISFGGHPGRVWQKVILWHDWMIDQRGPGLAYDLLTGKLVERPHPVTHKPVPWEFVRQGHHCNHAIASENFVTMRAGNATFVDLKTLGTGMFPGLRSGCTNSLVVAGGVLNSPMYAHLCDCGYEFFSSLAFTHMPDAELWTYRPDRFDFMSQPELGRVQRMGLNFNAPGERRAADGTLWFGWIKQRPSGYNFWRFGVWWDKAKPFRVPIADVQGDGPKWIFASGLEGLQDFTVPLCNDKEAEPQRHTVRLYFMDPTMEKPGERVFSVRLEGREVLKDFDVVKAAGGPLRGIVREFSGIAAGGRLKMSLLPKVSAPVISGIEVINESATTIPPEVHDTTVSARPGEPVKVELLYSDLDGPGPHTFRIAKPPVKGAVTGPGPTVVYTPNRDAFGRDSFSWVVNDGAKDSTEAWVAIRILAPNVPPLVDDVRVRAVAGKPTTIELLFRDPDESPGRNRFELVTEPAHGTAKWLSYNRVAYTPKADFAGQDVFTWRVNDGAADSKIAKATLLVTPDTEAPAVAWIDSAGPNDRIKVVFTEPVAKEHAENVANYTIGAGVQISQALLAADGRSVTLTTSQLREGVGRSLTIRGVRDCAVKPNAIKEGTRVPFTYVSVGTGLRGEYFAGKDFTGNKLGERVDPRIDFNWRRTPAFEGLKVGDEYSVRWTGRLKADHTEEYMLYFFKGWEHNRNPVRIWVDGEMLANDSIGRAAAEGAAFGTVSLQAGKVYDLKVELNITRPKYSKSADQYALRWSSLATPKQAIPQSNLGLPAGDAAQ